MVDTLVRIFVSYAREDDQYRHRLRTHLSSLSRAPDVEIFDDKSIAPGEDWERELLGRLEVADVVVVLRSADFVNSEFCYTVEFRRALTRRDAGKCEIFPVNVGMVSLRNDDPLGELQYYPEKPINRLGLGQAEDTWATISEKLQRMVDTFRTKKLATKMTDKAAASVIPIDRAKKSADARKKSGVTVRRSVTPFHDRANPQDVPQDWSGLVKALRYVDFGSCHSRDDLVVATSWLRAELALPRPDGAWAPDRTVSLIQELQKTLDQALASSEPSSAISSACVRCDQLKQIILNLLTSSGM